ncbi:MAG: YvcK family protein [Candidatus Omnitrophica bacterium]|nr:YvcK family protein [Candidatus Omnitrophota bacterium]MDD5553314.1 YvcK family protein [Candidatus Omnitrophota bacterium]
MKKRFNLKDLKLTRIRGILKWLYPGIGIKRWIGFSAFGILLVIVGSITLRTEEYWFVQILDGIVVISGIIILILGIKRMTHAFIAAVVPSSRGAGLVDMLYQKRQLGRGPKVVTIGGGTGLSVLLSGLKEYTSNITAIVTVADDGGSSGRLREQFDILPPGDIRNCLVALADASTLMRDLFQFRFDKSSEFSGHNFGNLFITVMTRLTGDFEKAIKETSKVLALRGQVIPSTLSNVALVAEHRDGTVTEGEDRIPKARLPINKVYLRPGSSLATPEAIKAIEEAQILVLGPGSLYTSIIPNLLIGEITDAIISSGAIKIYVCNAMTQPGETDGYSASDHIRALINHSNPRIFDYCILNTGEISKETLKRYAQDDSYAVVNDTKKVEGMGYRIIEHDIITAQDVVRHDPLKLAGVIMSFFEEA